MDNMPWELIGCGLAFCGLMIVAVLVGGWLDGFADDGWWPGEDE